MTLLDAIIARNVAAMAEDSAFVFLGDHHFRKRHGNITVYGTWRHLQGRSEPCLALMRTGDEGKTISSPYVLPLSLVALWNRETDHKLPEHITTKYALDAAHHLGLNTESGRVVIKIMAVINAHLGDLLAIPPYRAPRGEVVGEVTMQINGVKRTVEIADDGRGRSH